MWAEGDGDYMTAQAIEQIMQFVVNGVELIQIQITLSQSRLIGGNGDEVTSLVQPRDGLQATRYGFPGIGVGNGVAGGVVDYAISAQNDQFAQGGVHGVTGGQDYRKARMATSSEAGAESVHISEFGYPDAPIHHACLALHQFIHLCPEGVAQVEFGSNART